MGASAAIAELRALIPSDRGVAETFDLGRIRDVLAAVGNPHAGRPFVHVGGTSGKGSTASLLASILSAAGYRTGLHVSPHVVREHERAQVDGIPIADAELAELTATLRRAAAGLPAAPSYFEALWTIALLHFRRSATDIDVVEVGLGGELDATNVIDARHQILTNVGLEHVAVLGRTKAAILGVKQGIVKPHSTVVSGIREPHLRAQLERHARERAARVAFAGRDFQVRAVRQCFTDAGLPARVTFDYAEPGISLPDLALELPGTGQAANAGLAVALALRLAERWPRVDEAAIRAGLLAARPPGRVDIVGLDPLTIFDGAHNPAKMRWLAQAIRSAFPGRRFVSVFRHARRPDGLRTLETLAAISEHVILTDSSRPGDTGRTAPFDDAELARACARFGATVAASPIAALEQALDRARGRDDAGVLVTGSIYMLQEIYASPLLPALGLLGVSPSNVAAHARKSTTR